MILVNLIILFLIPILAILLIKKTFIWIADILSFIFGGNEEPEVYIEETDEEKEVDDIVKKFDIFVDRKENKLDTEPKEWKEYIGQEGVKETIQETLKAISYDKSLSYPHILVSGSAGYGKSCLIHLLAKKSNLPLIETIGGNLQEPKDIYQLFERIPKKSPYGIIFIDEIHSIKKDIGELLLPATQLFKISNKPIPYFTLAGATTDLGALTEKLSPLVDRCQQQFILEPYTNQQLAQIISNIAKKRKINITKSALLEIASRSRNTPRIAIGFLINVYYFVKSKNRNKIERSDVIIKLEKLGVYRKGITKRDIKLLKYLAKQEKPVGQSALTQVLNIDKKTYMNNIEPYLIREEFISRTPRGRVITKKGKEFLKSI